MKKESRLILLRHGESEWNRLNMFTGWVDIPLSRKGVEEAVAAGKRIADIPVDLIFVSSLIRSQMTAMLAMLEHKDGKIPYMLHTGQGFLDEWSQIYSEEAEKLCVPVVTAWQLNERMYGRLQGLNKQETMNKYGQEQVKLWRRSYDISPPEGESLQMTAQRTLPYFREMIIPALKQGKNVLVSAHGNSLRAIIMELDKLGKEEVLNLELPTGEPVIYRYSGDQWEKMQ